MAACQQVFVWGDLLKDAKSQGDGPRSYYRSFSLNHTTYCVGECVHLFPENETFPPYIGRVISAFVDDTSPDPHCIEIKWFERLSNLDIGQQSEPSAENEVVELEETDVNPIGCISGKCKIFQARSFAEASHQARSITPDEKWYYSRGVLHQEPSGQQVVVPYPDAGLPTGKRGMPGEGVADSDELNGRRGGGHGGYDQQQLHKRMRGSTDLDAPQALGGGGARLLPHQHHHPSMEGMVLLDHLHKGGSAGLDDDGDEDDGGDDEQPVASGSRWGGGQSHNSGRFGGGRSAAAAAPAAHVHRQCTECGATQTPQWREGPEGPKTLCNACGVRHCRARQRQGKRGSAGSSKGHGGHGADRNSGRQPVVSHSPPSLAPGAANVRPMRQAALAAATRTAAFARTGFFPSADQEAEEQAELYQQLLPPSPPPAPMGASSHLLPLGLQGASSSGLLPSMSSGGLGLPAAGVVQPLAGQAALAPAAIAALMLDVTNNKAQQHPQQQQQHGYHASGSGEDVMSRAAQQAKEVARASLLPSTCNGHGVGLGDGPLLKHEASGAPGGGGGEGVDVVSSVVLATEMALLNAVATAVHVDAAKEGSWVSRCADAGQYCPDVGAELSSALPQLWEMRASLPEDVGTSLGELSLNVAVATSEAVKADTALQATVQLLSSRQCAADQARAAAALAVQRLGAALNDVRHLLPQQQRQQEVQQQERLQQQKQEALPEGGAEQPSLQQQPQQQPQQPQEVPLEGMLPAVGLVQQQQQEDVGLGDVVLEELPLAEVPALDDVPLEDGLMPALDMQASLTADEQL